MTIELNAAAGGILSARIEGPGDTAGTETVFTAGIRVPEATDQNNFVGTAGSDIGQVLADSGDLSPGGDFDFHIIAHADVAATIHVERRNVADDAIIQTIQLALGANSPASLLLVLKDLLNNQSVRLTLQTDIANGDLVNTSISVVRR